MATVTVKPRPPTWNLREPWHLVQCRCNDDPMYFLRGRLQTLGMEFSPYYTYRDSGDILGLPLRRIRYIAKLHECHFEKIPAIVLENALLHRYWFQRLCHHSARIEGYTKVLKGMPKDLQHLWVHKQDVFDHHPDPNIDTNWRFFNACYNLGVEPARHLALWDAIKLLRVKESYMVTLLMGGWCEYLSYQFILFIPAIEIDRLIRLQEERHRMWLLDGEDGWRDKLSTDVECWMCHQRVRVEKRHNMWHWFCMYCGTRGPVRKSRKDALKCMPPAWGVWTEEFGRKRPQPVAPEDASDGEKSVRQGGQLSELDSVELAVEPDGSGCDGAEVEKSHCGDE